MPSLRDYRDRIGSVKSTRKITSAMKMVAAAKLKKSQDRAQASQPYAVAMTGMVRRLANAIPPGMNVSPLLSGNGRDDTYLLVVVTSDRGLCGGFNANVIRLARTEIRRLQAAGKTVKIICVGRKARDVLRREFRSLIIDSHINLGVRGIIGYEDARRVSDQILDLFAQNDFDVCTVLYNRFQSVLVQKPTVMPLIPFRADASAVNDNASPQASTSYTYEPDEETILQTLLPKNVAVQVFGSLLDSAAGEQAARMTAMDNATRNAGDMIKGLTLKYNRARQAYITKELIEIISGAEAV